MSFMQQLVKTELKDKKISYTNLKKNADGISFTLRDAKQVSATKKALKAMGDGMEIKVEDLSFNLTLSDSGMRQFQDKLIEQSINIIRRRIDETGTKEPSIQRQGEDYILLQVPGLENPQQLKDLLGRTAKLTFHLVVDVINQEDVSKYVIPAGMMIVEGDSEADKATPYFLLKKKVMLAGDRLLEASATITLENKAIVRISFDSVGAKLFGQLTSDNIGRYLAIVLDEKVISYARINDAITGGSCQISGNFSIKHANELALLLRAGALPAPISIVEERSVGPSLGADSIVLGKKAFLVSFALIACFMVAFYGIYGCFATVALLANIIFIVAILASLQASLTMPGIAGMILTMGMAVDANVLIFERIREELHKNISLPKAIALGFEHAFKTILDSNITTILVAIILYYFGMGAVKGFALTLMIGIASSMFSAITLTRLMIYQLLKFNKVRLI
jgi:preprotein translocase subunit SecD